jgi:pyruvate formate lyase activating enzyme
MWWEEKCIGCRDCQSVCTKGAISFPDDSLLLDETRCHLCGDCAEACHAEALKLVGQNLTVTQVMKEIEKDRAFYDESGGGVSLSGGEPLLQPDFAQSILEACKRLAIHTAVDTCGYVDSDVLMGISEHVDLFLYDLKLIDDDKHKSFTGVSNKLVLENLKKLSDSEQTTIVRFPLVPGVNDNEKDVLELGEFVSSLGGVREINILPYHKGGVEKSKRLNRPEVQLFKNKAPSGEILSRAEKKLKSFGFKVQVGG